MLVGILLLLISLSHLQQNEIWRKDIHSHVAEGSKPSDTTCTSGESTSGPMGTTTHHHGMDESVSRAAGPDPAQVLILTASAFVESPDPPCHRDHAPRLFPVHMTRATCSWAALTSLLTTCVLELNAFVADLSFQT